MQEHNYNSQTIKAAVYG